MSNDIKELKKDTEMLKNFHGNMKNELKNDMEKSISQITLKVEKETREQKEYITSLHQDIDEAIKRAKRDKSDNYLEVNKLSSKLRMVEMNNRRIEENLMKTVGAYTAILESIQMHLYILQQKEMHKQEQLLEEDSMRPYVAAEGDLLNVNRKKQTQEEFLKDDNVDELQQQLNRLDELMKENHKLYENQLKNEFEHYEEQKQLIESMRMKAKVTTSDSMPRLRSAKKRVTSPSKKQVRPNSLVTMKLADDYRTTKLPDFGPFKQKKSVLGPKNFPVQTSNNDILRQEQKAYLFKQHEMG
jgi:hypothetical protein